MKIDLSCPVELWHFKLPTSVDPAVYLHLFNLGHKAVNSVQAAFLCFNEKGEKLSRQVERVQGLSGDSRSAFEMRVLVEDGLLAASMDFIIEKVWYVDGTIWRRNINEMAEYTPNNLPEGRQLKELRQLAGADALGYPSDQGGVWVCICGRPNPSGSGECARCERDKHDVFTLYNAAAIEKIIIEQDNALEEKERQQREEGERLLRAQQEKEKKKQKVRKRLTIGLASAVLLDAGTLTPLDRQMVAVASADESAPRLSALLAALAALAAPPDLALVEGHGIAHPEGFGIASHFGVATDLPCIGVATAIDTGTARLALHEMRGAFTPLRDGPRQIGWLLRSLPDRPPLVVSPGHRVSLASAPQLVMRFVTADRRPEPTRLARLLLHDSPAAGDA